MPQALWHSISLGTLENAHLSIGEEAQRSRAFKCCSLSYCPSTQSSRSSVTSNGPSLSRTSATNALRGYAHNRLLGAVATAVFGDPTACKTTAHQRTFACNPLCAIQSQQLTTPRCAAGAGNTTTLSPAAAAIQADHNWRWAGQTRAQQQDSRTFIANALPVP
jgi:hypothetical protein